MKKNGTMVTVQQHCKNCPTGFTWRSQPLIMGNYPAGNILLSFAILMAGASISKIFLIFQSKLIFPAILHHWESYQLALISSLIANKNLVWSGDGRFDSMGHSAKCGVYSMMCSPSNKIVHFELLQV